MRSTVLDRLEELAITDEIYLFYTTDHSTPGSGNRPLALGGERSERGFRVSLFLRGPEIVPGSASRVRRPGWTWFPTWQSWPGL